MSWLIALDTALLRIHGVVAAWCGRQFGSTCASLARSCILGSGVFGSAAILLLREEGGFDLCGLMAFNLAVTVYWYWKAQYADCVPNPYELQPPVCRLVVPFTLILFLPLVNQPSTLRMVFIVFSDVLLISYFYILAVPKPPAKKKRKKAVTKLSYASVGW